MSLENYTIHSIGKTTHSIVIKAPTNTDKQHNAFCDSICQILPGAYRDGADNIIFVAHEVTPLSNAQLNTTQCSFLIQCLCKQLMYLEEANITIHGIDIHDVIVVDNTYTCIANPELMADIHHNNMHIISPISKARFTAPEIRYMRAIPAKFPRQSSYYGIGMLVLHWLREAAQKPDNPQKGESESPSFSWLKGTKFYWFIKRCTDPDPSNRTLLFI